MALPRVIPCLLLCRRGLWKTTRFAEAVYVGDPLNVARIFNDKEVDEIVVLDIERGAHGPAFELLGEFASEVFMPMCYGGRVRSVADFERLFGLGIEKVTVNTAAVDTPTLVEEAATRFGSQSVAVSVDVRDGRVWVDGAARDTGLDVVDWCQRVVALGAGEVLLTSIEREGTATGYDLDLVQRVAAAVSVPVIANGGAGSVADLRAAFAAGAGGVAAGRMFVQYGRFRAVLITYPSADERASLE